MFVVSVEAAKLACLYLRNNVLNNQYT